jgi:hypothetical protein
MCPFAWLYPVALADAAALAFAERAPEDVTLERAGCRTEAMMSYINWLLVPVSPVFPSRPRPSEVPRSCAVCRVLMLLGLRRRRISGFPMVEPRTGPSTADSHLLECARCLAQRSVAASLRRFGGAGIGSAAVAALFPFPLSARTEYSRFGRDADPRSIVNGWIPNQ